MNTINWNELLIVMVPYMFNTLLAIIAIAAVYHSSPAKESRDER